MHLPQRSRGQRLLIKFEQFDLPGDRLLKLRNGQRENGGNRGRRGYRTKIDYRLLARV